jgi:adenylate cyclase
MPESAQRDRRELELRLRLLGDANASDLASDVEQDATLARALELCGRTGDARSWAYILSFQTRSLITECELDAAESMDQERVERTATLDDPALLAAAHSERGDIAFLRGEIDRAQPDYALCLSALEGVGSAEPDGLLRHDPGTVAAGRLASIHWLQGHPDEAHRDAAACLARAEALGEPLNLAIALGLALLPEVFRRDVDRVNALAKAYRELTKKYGFHLPHPALYAVLSWPLAQREGPEAAIAQLREGVTVSRGTGVREELSHLLGSLAETELARGHAKEGLVAIEEARAFVEKTGERFWEAEIHRLEGELRRLDGEDGRAEACFQTALDVASRQGALSLELRAATSLSRLWHDTGRGRDACPLLSDVYGRFREGFDTPDLRDARVLLDSL